MRERGVGGRGVALGGGSLGRQEDLLDFDHFEVNKGINKNHNEY